MTPLAKDDIPPNRSAIPHSQNVAHIRGRVTPWFSLSPKKMVLCGVSFHRLAEAASGFCWCTKVHFSKVPCPRGINKPQPKSCSQQLMQEYATMVGVPQSHEVIILLKLRFFESFLPADHKGHKLRKWADPVGIPTPFRLGKCLIAAAGSIPSLKLL